MTHANAAQALQMATRNVIPLGREAERRLSGQVAIAGLEVAYACGGGMHLAVAETTLNIGAGEFVCLLGPSGCGKSTVLNSVAGFVRPTRGRVTIDGREVAGPGPERGMVFQQHALFPWKTALDNVAFGPRMRGRPRGEARALAREHLERVGLAAAADRYPAALSGGMQQRVAIARALINHPRVLLLDEPFGALDAQTRSIMQENLLQLWSRVGTTVLFVTHEVDEAIFMADRVVIMSASPGQVIAELPIPLARPRDREMLTDDAFVRIKRECLRIIGSESRKTFDRQIA